MNILEFTAQMNTWGQASVPFLFMVDFEMEKPLIIKWDEALLNEIIFSVNGKTNAGRKAKSIIPSIEIEKRPITREEYEKKFKVVFDELCYGDSFLTNLTIKTE